MNVRVCALLFLASLLVSTRARADEPEGAEMEPPTPAPRAHESLSPPEPGEDVVELPAKIDAVVVNGLTRTKAVVVHRELGFAAGDTITREQLDLAVTRLWNTTIFAHVTARVVRGRAGQVLAVFDLEDRWTLNPLLGYGAGGSAFYFRVGAADNNVAGRFLEAQAQYQYFDGFHGGQMILRDPRTFNRRIETTFQLERLVRPRPEFSDQRTLARVEMATLVNDDSLRLGMRVDGFMDRFLPPLDPPSNLPAATNSVLIEPNIRFGRVDTVRLMQKGGSVELRQGFGITDSEIAPTYTQTTVEALRFVTIGSRINLALRARLANISHVPPHLRLYVGGLDLLRGYQDNFVRTNGYMLYNAELRYVVYDSTWVAFMPVAFTDGNLSQDSPHALFSAGVGIRVLVPKFVGTGLRADLAIPFDNPHAEPNFGVYQFF